VNSATRARELATGLSLMIAAAPLAAQSLESRVFARPDAQVRMSYASRPGACGGENGNISWADNDDERDGWKSDCQYGPVRLTLTVTGGAVVGVKTRVGGQWLPREGVVDLGTVSSRAAASFLLGVAKKGGKAGEDAILPAMLADSVELWPDLIKLARDKALGTEVRKSALFWVGQAAATAATAGLADVAGDMALDRDVREAAVFALSQRPHDEGVPALLAVAANDKDPKIRKSAIFWLGQSDDPRALTFFEAVLTKAPASH
jgi:hypothetical protein